METNLGQTPYFNRQPPPADGTAPTAPGQDTDAKKSELYSDASGGGSAPTATQDSSGLEKKAGAHLHGQMRAQELLAATAPAPAEGLSETRDSTKFRSAIQKAKDEGKDEDIDKGTFGTRDSKWFGAFVHTYEEKEYREMTMLLTPDDKAGEAIKQSGDIVSVFKHPKSTVKDFVGIALPEAVRRGGTHLDCFAGDLPIRYSRHGFVPVAKVKFSDDFKPDDWNFARDGRPDIIFMAYDPQATIETDVYKRRSLIETAIAQLPYSSTYEEGSEAQQAFVEAKKQVKT